MLRALDSIGRTTTRAVDEAGYAGVLFLESLFWLLAGRRERQPVRIETIFQQMLQIGLQALQQVTGLLRSLE